MTVQTLIKPGATVDVLPVALARRILTPPAHDAPDHPLWCWSCPYCGDIKLIPEELTLWPHFGECRFGKVVLRPGSEVFIGSHLLTGYPDQLPDRLRVVLSRLAALERENGHESRWMVSRPIPSTWVPEPPKPTTPALFTGGMPPRKR